MTTFSICKLDSNFGALFCQNKTRIKRKQTKQHLQLFNFIKKAKKLFALLARR